MIDDPVKNKQEAFSKEIRDRSDDNYKSSIRTRLQPEAAIVLMCTRWHEDDLAGRLLKRAQENPDADQWTVLVLSATNDQGRDAYVWDTATGEKKYFPPYEALWPTWFSRKALNTIEIELGPVFWSAMYKQAPSMPEGEIFKRAAWREMSGAVLTRKIQI